MRIQHNIMAMNAYRNYNNNTSALSKNLEKLSSGYKINRAGDDAAGLAISEKMRAQITGLDKAQDNAKDGISLVQTAEGALTEVHDMLNRMYELAEQSANGTYEGSTDRAQLQKEVKQLRDEIDRIADSANFNGIKLLNGDMDTNGTAAFTGTATPSAAAVNLNISALQTVTKSDGSKVTPTFKFAHNSTVASQGAKVDANGAVTITIDASKNYTAADIQDMLKNAKTTATVDDAILAAVQEATVSGSGITAATGTANKVAGNAGTAAALSGAGSALVLQIGDTSDDFNQLSVSIKDCHAAAIGIGDIDISEQDGAAAALDVIKNAINYVSDVRGTLGATQNRLDHTINNLSVMQENIQDAESTIRDTDVADEMMAYTKNNILIQSAQAMLAQANQVPQGVLQLLQ